MRFLKSLFITLIALFGITFACLNAQPTLINYFIGNTQLPLSLLLAITLILGSFLGILAMISLYFHQKTQKLRLEHRLKLAEKELTNLRAIPLKDKV